MCYFVQAISPSDNELWLALTHDLLSQVDLGPLVTIIDGLELLPFACVSILVLCSQSN